jgi:glycosyltransferase involved in cell wall biosynthesis
MRIGIDVGILREERRGVGHYLSNLLEKFLELDRDDEFYFYTPRPIKSEIREEIIKKGANNWHLRIGTLPLPGSFWLQTEGRHLIIKDEIDTLFAPAHIAPLNLPKRIKKVLAVHDLLPILYPGTMANYNLFVHKIFFKKSIAEVDVIITMSETTKNDLIRYLGVKRERIEVIYEGVGEIFHPYEKAAVIENRHRYGLERPYILSCGTLEPRKNYAVLLSAFKRLKTDYDLVIIGKKGWKYGEVFAWIEKLNLAKWVKLLGYVPQDSLPLFYCGAEIFVFPSLYEGFGLPLLEAMACGVPVVSSNASCLPEIGGDACLYFAPHSVEDLVSQMERLLSDTNLRKELAKRGIERAREFTWEKTARKTLQVLKGDEII